MLSKTCPLLPHQIDIDNFPELREDDRNVALRQAAHEPTNKDVPQKLGVLYCHLGFFYLRNGEKEENESMRRGQRSEVRAVLVLVVPGLVAERASLDLRVGELLPRVDVEARPGHAHQRSAVLSAAACSARILNTQNGLLAT